MKSPLPSAFALALALLVGAGAPAIAASADTAAADTVTLDFDNADIVGVARTLTAITHRNVVLDPRVKGTISLNTETPVTPREAWRMFVDVLRLSGWSVVEAGGLSKIVPEADARLMATSVTVAGGRASGDGIATEIFRLDYQSAANLVPVLRPLISPNNVINMNPGTNALVITDYTGNLARLRTLVAALDVPGATDVEVIALRNTTANDIAATVRRLSSLSRASADTVATTATPAPTSAAAQPSQAASAPNGASGGSATEASIVVDTQTNSLLVRAQSRAQIAAIRALVAQLDQPRDNVNVRVVYLKNAQAVRLAQVLRAAFPAEASDQAAAGRTGNALASPGQAGGTTSASSDTGMSSTSGTSSGKASAATPSSVTAAGQPTTGGGIQADPASNALIITAPEPRFREMRPIIEQLDTRRAQLYVESLVVEVDASKSVELGVQWAQLFDINSATTLTLGTVAKALESMAGTNILSTANVVTLDNEEARIVVGQNVPYITGSYTTSTNANPFQTVERKDVGITLRLRPQIGENGNIRMTIYQESSSVASTSATLGPTTNQRSIESTVTVNDGKIIVLGGLIEDSYSDQTYRLPWVSELPLVGNLFRSFARSRKKTNLIVFLRPVAMRDEAAADAWTLDRYDYIRGRQQAMPADIGRLPGNFVVPPAIAPGRLTSVP
ncbi:secretin N-terminal domain-containing protein [Xylophilus sp. GOD-11R]|uniref:secretin N-terminal domain-containing protein n=1 Tax=Xylophilus sp. GOD-11R TaxID=3089814 RepID=UPI00298C9958|nr:secretin N-terminal domain-containing protein [Xylophilus sp. GOD-11R]WPB59227.1 secretin N-terminal domain-containing protein [Xylophilus sp. GOD-11R]